MSILNVATVALKCLTASKMPRVPPYLQFWVEEENIFSTMCLLLKNVFCRGGNSVCGGFGGVKEKGGDKKGM